MKKNRLWEIMMLSDTLGITEHPSVHIDRICLIMSGMAMNSESTDPKYLANDSIRCYESILGELLEKKTNGNDNDG